MNRYLVAFTKYKSYFSIELEMDTYSVEAENMKAAVKKVKDICSVYQIIAITNLDDSIDWEDVE
jgi:uncharacterized OsmC-like protein